MLVLAAYVTDTIKTDKNFLIQSQNFDSSTSPHPIMIKTPVVNVKSFDLQFDGLATNSDYDNFIQISGKDGNSRIRLELQPGQKLTAIFGQTVIIQIDPNFTLNKWHHFHLSGEKGKYFKINIDGKQRFHFDISSLAHRLPRSNAEILLNNFDLGFNTISLGTGYSPPRNLQGNIKNFNMSARYTPRLLPAPLLTLSMIILGVAILWLLWPEIGLRLTTGGSVGDTYVLGLILVFTSAGFAGYALNIGFGHWDILIGCGLGVSIVVLLSHSKPKRSNIAIGKYSVIAAVFLAAAMAFSLRQLPSVERALYLFKERPLESASVLALSLGLAMFACRQILDGVSSDIRSHTKLLSWVPYIILAAFALRTNALFVGSSDFHWDYFVGPLIGIKAGGHLLWDVPSQYGFLNILLASLIPTKSAWDAFFLFQAASFWIAASLFYRAMWSIFGCGRIVALLIVIATFFLADPDLIGPSPYPSSSAVRFLWCYVLIYLAASNFLGDRPSLRRHALQGGLAWTISSLWSAESAVYGSAIFFAPIAMHFVLKLISKNPPRALLRDTIALILTPVTMLLVAWSALAIYYNLALGHLLDFSMYLQYVVGYGDGFGSTPIHFLGPIWVFVFIIFAGTNGLRASLGRDANNGGSAALLASMVGGVWVIATYYIGRAYPSNVIALMPLLCFSMMAILSTSKNGQGVRLSQIAITLPLLTLALISAYWNVQIPNVIHGLMPHPLEVHTKLSHQNEELALLLKQSGIQPDSRVLFYGDDPVMPTSDGTTYESTWLPQPLQLLEKPIKKSQREKIVTRFAQGHPDGGYLVLARGQSEDRANTWITLLNKLYVAKQTFTSEHYRVIAFASQSSHSGQSHP